MDPWDSKATKGLSAWVGIMKIGKLRIWGTPSFLEFMGWRLKSKEVWVALASSNRHVRNMEEILHEFVCISYGDGASNSRL